MAERTRARSSTVVLAGLLSNLRTPLMELAESADQAESLASRSDGPTRMRQRRLTPADIDRLVLEYEQGSTIDQLARDFKVHKTTVAGHLSRRGVERRVVAGLDASQVEQAVAMYGHGDSLATIGQRLGFDPQTINLALRKADVEIRRRRGWST